MKFRLKESISDNTVEKILNKFNRLSETEILNYLPQGSIVNNISEKTPLFITPSGKIIDVGKATGIVFTVHIDLIMDILDKLVEEEIGTTDEYILWEENYNEEILEALDILENKGWIRLNTGTSDTEDRFYAVLPYKDAIKPTERQYDIFKDFLETGKANGQRQVLLYFGNEAKWYDLEDTEEVIEKIKRYYAGFSFYESKQIKAKRFLENNFINEVYPNKGESKKDFIARFMSVTKDEYPDIKQRYAVALSYWARRKKEGAEE